MITQTRGESRPVANPACAGQSQRGNPPFVPGSAQAGFATAVEPSFGVGVWPGMLSPEWGFLQERVIKPHRVRGPAWVKCHSAIDLNLLAS